MTEPIESGLKNTRVVVIGGTSGIGYAVAEAAAAAGALVTVVSSSQERVDAACRSLNNVHGEVVDTTRPDQIAALFAKVGTFDHLVYTAGEALLLDTIDALDIDAARRAFEIRYWGALTAVKHASRHLRNSGSITLTSGVASQRPLAGWSIAASILGALESLTRALAVELAPLRVNAVSSGVLRTPMWNNMSETDRHALYEQIAEKMPVKRVGEASDSAKAYLYLMTQTYGTGQIVVADGGHVLV
ncbi:MAG TPA: SDR family oxidoreductase [Pararobbsia sp.]|nr:SDR family oxidoreductase [Pararobbsia sp.]